MNVPNRDLNDMLFYAFRYTLGRMTYSTGTVSDLLLKYQAEITNNNKELIVKEITKAIASNRAGMQMDIDLWLKVKEEFENANN